MGLIFKPELIEKILAGEKTQTRRPIKPGDVDKVNPLEHAVITGDDGRLYVAGPKSLIDTLPITAVERNGRTQWAVGRDYAIVPGRGKKAVEGVRIRITRIRQEDARDISDEDVRAEGFRDKFDFLHTWCSFYDKAALSPCFLLATGSGRVIGVDTARLKQRPDALYQAWALTFEVVRS